MSMKDNFYANFPKAQKGTNYMDLTFLTFKEKNIARDVITYYYKKIKSPESRYAEFSHVISKCGQHIVAKVMDEQDIQTFITLASTLDKAVKNGVVVDKKGKFTNLSEVIRKIREEGKKYYGQAF